MTQVASEQALSVLRTQFGLNEFRPKQIEVIERVLKRQHTLALLPTGYGKSICYQVPAQILPGVTVVVSPLIALMQDQVNGLLKRGITNATMLNSTLDYREISARIAGIKSGAYKLIYVAPERFDSEQFRGLLNSVNISLMVIDEAHCISQWGHDFRPQYRNLGHYVREFGDATVLAVTATATPNVKVDIVRNLALPEMEVVEGSFDRPNLLFSVKGVSGGKEKDQLVEGLVSANSGGCIIYTSSRKEAERVATLLKRTGLRTACYHAGLSPDKRERAQKSFEADKLDVIVCTVAFGMGVDKANIRQVIHNNLPGSLESYYQEAGRAGRDGQKALCTLLFQPKDIHIQKWLIDQKDVVEELKKVDRRRLESMIDYAQTSSCRRKRILGYFGQMLEKCEGCDVCDGRAVNAFTDVPAKAKPIAKPKSVGVPPAAKDSRSAKSPLVAAPTASVSLQTHILAIAFGLSGKLGRTTFAQILTGSKAAKLSEKGLDRIPQFGSCSSYKQDTVVGSIDELIDSGYLKVSGGLYPKVSMTPSGRMYFSTLA